MQLFIAFTALIIAIISHIVATVWWASAITTTLRFQAIEMKRIGQQLSGYDGKFYGKEEAMKQVDKRDREVENIFEEIGKLRDRISTLEGASR